VARQPMSDSEFNNIVKEVSRPDYIQRARQRARRRKSPWNLLLIPLVACSCGVISYVLLRVVLFCSSTVAARPASFAARSEPIKTLLVIPLLIAAIPSALIAANFLIHLLPPARRALDKEAEGHAGCDYLSSQHQLWALGRFVAVVCIGISLLVAILFR
jgi:hypothetical protein